MQREKKYIFKHFRTVDFEKKYHVKLSFSKTAPVLFPFYSVQNLKHTINIPVNFILSHSGFMKIIE